MLMKLKRPCGMAVCSELVISTKYYCEYHDKQIRKHLDEERGTAAFRGYGRKWQRARKYYLARHPLCVECTKEDRVRAATVVDHIIPHRGDRKLFWDVSNWQPLCKRHHDIKTGREGYARKT